MFKVSSFAKKVFCCTLAVATLLDTSPALADTLVHIYRDNANYNDLTEAPLYDTGKKDDDGTPIVTFNKENSKGGKEITLGDEDTIFYRANVMEDPLIDQGVDRASLEVPLEDYIKGDAVPNPFAVYDFILHANKNWTRGFVHSNAKVGDQYTTLKQEYNTQFAFEYSITGTEEEILAGIKTKESELWTAAFVDAKAQETETWDKIINKLNGHSEIFL